MQLSHFLFCASVLAGSATASFAEAPTVYGKKNVFARVEAVTLTSAQKSHYRNFRREDAYFGAFYVTSSGDGSYYTYGYHDLSLAKAIAKRGCEAIHQGPCTFFAVAVPEGVDPNATQASGLGAVSALDYNGIYRDRQTTDGYGAFAVSGSAHHGYSFDWPNAAEARAAAIAFCEVEVAKALTEVRIIDREWAKSNGLTTCRIIDSYAPAGG
ncbi:MAG: hypothetical protein ABJL67_07830 [Sulfitobacter sp.]